MIGKRKRRNKGPEPIYRCLQESIIAKVNKGEFQPDDALPSENHLAKEYGISRGSVRTALKELQNKGIIYSVVGKGSFINRQIFNQPSIKQNRIAFIVPSLDGSDLQIYRGIEDTLNAAGYMLSIFNSQRSIEQENKNLKLLLEGKEMGAIIFPNWGQTNAEALFELKMAGYPFVLIDRYFRELETDYVVTDNKRGGFLATEHLIKLGHKQIGIILGLTCTAIEDRFEGYREALAQYGLIHEPALMRRFQRDDTEENEPSAEIGYNEAVDLLKERPTAIFATNDFLARGAIKAVQDAGMDIPKDISIIGFDNQGFAESLNPALTTIAQPFYQFGQRAVEMVLRRLDNSQENQGFKRVTLEPKLVKRQSCLGPAVRR
jgi:GntR family transcriptional regulator of arabinose operon